MDNDVVDAHGRHSGHQWLPFRSTIQRDKHAILSANIQKILVLRIFTNDVHGAPLRKIVHERVPGRAVVFSDKEIRLEIVQTMSVNCEITRGCIESRWLKA